MPTNREAKISISVITAMARNRVIGSNNTLPWHCPQDLKRFKTLTMGHYIIMGRKTFDSIGKPLVGRTTVIVTRNRDLKIEGCIMAHSLEEAIAACKGEIFIVGGAELYALALPVVNKLYITEIQQEFDGDTYFPAFDKTKWREIAREERHQDAPQLLDFHFVIYELMG